MQGGSRCTQASETIKGGWGSNIFCLLGAYKQPQPRRYYAVQHPLPTFSPTRGLSCPSAGAVHLSPAAPSHSCPRLKEAPVPPFHRPAATEAAPEGSDPAQDTSHRIASRPSQRTVPGHQRQAGGRAPGPVTRFKLSTATYSIHCLREDETCQARPAAPKGCPGHQPPRRRKDPGHGPAVRPPLAETRFHPAVFGGGTVSPRRPHGPLADAKA